MTIIMMGVSIWAHFFDGSMTAATFLQMVVISPLSMLADLIMWKELKR